MSERNFDISIYCGPKIGTVGMLDGVQLGWWFQTFFYFNPYLGKRFPFWLIFFKGVGSTTKQFIFFWMIILHSLGGEDVWLNQPDVFWPCCDLRSNRCSCCAGANQLLLSFTPFFRWHPKSWRSKCRHNLPFFSKPSTDSDGTSTYIYLYMKTLNINHSCRYNIPVPWILWEMTSEKSLLQEVNTTRTYPKAKRIFSWQRFS